MKKALILVVICVLAGFTLYKLLAKKEEKKEDPTETALIAPRNSDAFNTAFGNLMKDYYSLKDAFVDWDSVKVNQTAAALKKTTDSIPLSEFKADSTLVETAGSFLSSMSGEIQGLLGENNIEDKRKSFNMLTSELYDLIRTVRYDGAIVYHAKCPMAFGDSAEGYWLSDRAKIINPYLGKHHPSYKDKMLSCGEIVDSLDFSKKQ